MQAQNWEVIAQEYVVDSPDMLQTAGEDLRAIKSLQKEVEEKRVAITGPLNQALSAVNNLFRAPEDYLVRAEGSLKSAILTYQQEQERIAAEARRAAEEEARRERERLMREAREQEAKARQAAADARAAAEAAAKAKAEGDEEAARQAQEQAAAATEAAEAAESTAQDAEIESAVVTAVPVAEAPRSVSGLSGRVTYSAKVEDLMKLLQAVVDGKAPIEAVTADEKFLGAQARAFKKAGELYPGVVITASRSIAARAA